MQKFLFYSLICLANIGTAYALPTGARASSVKSVTNTATSVLPQKNTTTLVTAPTSLSNKTNTITNTKSKETSAATADTERFGSTKAIKSNFSSKISVPSSSGNNNTGVSSSEIERLYNHIETLQAQIDQLQNELSRKAESDEVNQMQRELANKAESVDVIELNEAITEAKQDTERKINQFKQESGASQYLTLDKLNSAIANKEIMQDFAKKDEVANAKREAISAANSETTDKIVNLNTAFNEKLRNYATNEKMFNDIAIAKGEAIAVADQDSREKFANLNANISEDAIKVHFDKFLDSEVKNQNGKFKEFLTHTDKEILEDAIDDAIVEAVAVAENSADNKFVKSDKLTNELRNKIDVGFLAEKGILTGNTLDGELVKKGIDKATLIADIKSAKNDAIDAATADADDKISSLDKRITDIASGQIDEEGLKTNFDKLLDTELDKGGRFDRFAKNDEITPDALDRKLSDIFAYKKDLVGLTKDSELSDRVSGILDSEIQKEQNGKFKEFAVKDDLADLIKNGELANRFDDLLNSELAKGTNSRFKDFAVKNDLSGLAKNAELAGKFDDFLNSELGKTGGKFSGFTKDADLNSKISTLENFKGLSDRITANANRFSNYTDNDNLNTKIATLQNFKGLSDTVSGHSTTLSGLNDTIDTRINGKGFLTANSSTITGLSGRLTTAEGNITANTNKFADYTKTNDLNSKIATLSNFTTLANRLNNAETALSDDSLNAKLANLSNFTNLQTRMNTAELNIDDLDTNIGSTNSAVQALNSGTAVPRRAIRRTTAASSDDEEP